MSWRAHRELMSRDDRFDLIRPHMTLNEASRAACKSTSARGGEPAATIISILTEIAEIQRRARAVFRATVQLSPGEGAKEQLLARWAEAETEFEQYRNLLTGTTVDEAIEKIMEGT